MKLVFENFTPVKIVKGQCISSHLFLFTSAAHFTAASRNAKLSTPDWLRFVAAVLLCGSSFFSVVFERQTVLWKDRNRHLKDA